MPCLLKAIWIQYFVHRLFLLLVISLPALAFLALHIECSLVIERLSVDARFGYELEVMLPMSGDLFG